MPTSLIVSRHFPPLSSVGSSIRLVKLIKYLDEKDWRFFILTQDPGKTVVPEEQLSRFMEKEIPADTQVIRIPAPFVSIDVPRAEARTSSHSLGALTRLLGFLLDRILPESSLWWGFRVFQHGIKISKNNKIDLIYTVTPVFTNALIGTLLSRVRRIPLVLDMKDDWVGSTAFQQKPVLRKAVERWFESEIIKSASKVILVTERSYLLYKERYKKLASANRFELIPNGCDLFEYRSLWGKERPMSNKTFRILSAAWGYRKDYRDITPFFSALSLFLKRNPDTNLKIEVVLLGNSLSKDYGELLDQARLRNIVRETSALDRENMVEELSSADLFLLVQPVGNTTAISGTIYEYWAVGYAPILLISEQGASSDLVSRYHLGECFNFNQLKGIADYIEKVYNAKLDKSPMTISSQGVDAFDRKMLANKMASIWQECIQGQMAETSHVK